MNSDQQKWILSGIITLTIIIAGALVVRWISHTPNEGQEFEITDPLEQDDITDSVTPEKDYTRLVNNYRDLLDRANTRREVKEVVSQILLLNHKPAMDMLKLKMLNHTFIDKIAKLDQTGQKDARGRPEVYPYNRRLNIWLIRKVAKSGNPHSADLILTILDTNTLRKPENNYLYIAHLEAILAISWMPKVGSRAAAVLRRIVKNQDQSRNLAEIEWALVALHNSGLPELFDVIKDYSLQEDIEFRQATLGLKTLMQTNDPIDIRFLCKVASASTSPKVRSFIYNALAGIPCFYDEFGVRITAQRQKASVKVLEKIKTFLTQQGKVERDPKSQYLLRTALARISRLLARKKNS